MVARSNRNDRMGTGLNMSEYALWDGWDSGYLIVFELLCGYLLIWIGWDSGEAQIGVARRATVDTGVVGPTLRRRRSLGWGY